MYRPLLLRSPKAAPLGTEESPYVCHAVTLRPRMNSSDDSKNVELVDKAGRSILNLLQKAADTADQNSRQAVEVAQKLSQQLRAVTIASPDWRVTSPLTVSVPSARKPG